MKVISFVPDKPDCAIHLHITVSELRKLLGIPDNAAITDIRLPASYAGEGFTMIVLTIQGIGYQDEDGYPAAIVYGSKKWDALVEKEE